LAQGSFEYAFGCLINAFNYTAMKRAERSEARRENATNGSSVTSLPFRAAARGLATLAAFSAAFGAAGASNADTANVPLTVAQFTNTQPNQRFAQLYKLRYLTAKSVADVLRRSFANVSVSVLTDVNGVMVTANAAQQQRIADALAQLDVPAGTRAPRRLPVRAVSRS